MQRAGHLATSHTGLNRKSPITGRGIPPIGVLHALHSLLVRNASVSKTLQWQPKILRGDTVGVLGLPAAVAKAGVSISHNCVR